MKTSKKTNTIVSSRHNKRLEEITRTAVSLFYRYGFIQTSTRDIAEACGISKGHLYYYINSKEDLLSLSVEISLKQIEKFALHMMKDIKVAPQPKVLTNAIRETIKMIDNLQEMILFWYRESGHVSLASLNKLIKQDMYTVDLYKMIIEEGVKKGEFKISDPTVAAFDIMLLCDMWSLKRWYMQKHYSLDEYISVCQEIALGIVHAKEKTNKKSRGKSSLR